MPGKWCQILTSQTTAKIIPEYAIKDALEALTL